MRKRAVEEAGMPLPDDFLIHDIDFDFIEIEHIEVEKAWFAANPDKGSFTQWPLFGSLLPPQLVNATERASIANDTATLWALDHLPDRLTTIRQWLATPTPKPTVFFWHCEAGCDRTGEMSAAYYMTYQGYNVTGAFAKDTLDCGRPPNYFSAGAIEWYCLNLEETQGKSLGDCLSLPI